MKYIVKIEGEFIVDAVSKEEAFDKIANKLKPGKNYTLLDCKELEEEEE